MAFGEGRIGREDIAEKLDPREVEIDKNFSELSSTLVEGKWETKVSSPWGFNEAQAKLEARAAVAAVRSAVANEFNHDRHVLVLGDALGFLPAV